MTSGDGTIGIEAAAARRPVVTDEEARGREERRLRLLEPVRGSRGRALEVGPLDRPLLRDFDGEVRFADHRDQAGLRAKYALDEAIDPAGIPEIHHVVGPGGLTAAGVEPGSFDLIVASHVVEHVPDLLGWLAELEVALRPGGRLLLAVPDRDLIFDRDRGLSSAGDAYQAYLERRRVPSPRHVFDFVHRFRKVDAGAVWSGGDEAPARAPRSALLAAARDSSRVESELAEPMDVHCWTFTPSSFVDVLRDATALGILHLELERLFETRPGELEFSVVLARPLEPRAADELEASFLRAAPVGRRPESKPEREHRLAQERLDLLRGSRSWRLTAPLRRAARALATLRRTLRELRGG